MSVELEAQRQFAVDRTRSIESKAGFLVVAGGLLAAQTLPTLTHGPLQSFAVVLAVTRLVIAFAVTLLAAMALWPLKLRELVPNLRTCVPLQANSDSSRR